VTTWFSSSKQRAKQQQRVNESLRELDDWDDLGNRPYTVPGASPVQDSLDDISQGWGPDQAPVLAATLNPPRPPGGSTEMGLCTPTAIAKTMTHRPLAVRLTISTPRPTMLLPAATPTQVCWR
jgi:hypothetical protein